MSDQHKQIVAAGVLCVVSVFLLAVHCYYYSGEPVPAVLRYPIDTLAPTVYEPNVAFSGDWPRLPKRMRLYRAIRPDVNEAYVRAIGERYFDLGPDAQCSRQDRIGPRGCLSLSDGARILHVHLESGSFDWLPRRRPLNTDPNDFPAAEQWGRIAKDYLAERGLLPGDAVIDEITANLENPGEVVVRFCRVIDGCRSWGSDGRIFVRIGPGGKVHELSYAWTDIKSTRRVRIRSPREAMEALVAGEGTPVNRDARIESISLRYFCSICGRDYFQPVYHFEGTHPDGKLWGVLAPALPKSKIQSKEQLIEEYRAEQDRYWQSVPKRPGPGG